VIEVEVRRDDVADVAGTEAELTDPGERGVLDVGPDPEAHLEGDPETPVGMAHVVGAHPGVDEDEPVRRLNDEAMAGDEATPHAGIAREELRPERAHGPRVDVVDAHAARESRTSRSRIA
jgi:hypothetical protein